jgi:ubiquinone/menaquinone biosynthesis C-methylase UbiE
MGEIFERPMAAHPLPFTGERLTTALSGQTEIEHIHRYVLARHLCRGRDVLDVASGEGYGAALLAQTAASVVGVEVAEDAVVHAAASYKAPNLRFLRSDARSLPLCDATIDIVVSFETIEHFVDHERFLAEIRRVLRPGGLVIISTPDRDIYSPTDQPANPFHVLELTREEFAALLRKHFVNVVSLLQRVMIGSAMEVPAEVLTSERLCIERRGLRHLELSVGLARPQYIIAVASDVALPPIPGSLYLESGSIVGWTEAIRQALAAKADGEVATQRRAREAAEAVATSEREAREKAEAVATSEREAREKAEAVATSEREAREKAEAVAANEREAYQRVEAEWRAQAVKTEQAELTLARLESELAGRKALLVATHASWSWHLTAPLRATVRWLRMWR